MDFPTFETQYVRYYGVKKIHAGPRAIPFCGFRSNRPQYIVQNPLSNEVCEKCARSAEIVKQRRFGRSSTDDEAER